MLKTPLSPQPCSSSPISERSGSAESVVFPVPESPKKIATRPCVVDVRRAVHREDALERKPVVHHREDRLLDLARVERAADQHLGAARVQHDERARPRPVLLRIGLDGGRVQDERLRLEVLAAPPSVGSMNIVFANSAWYGCEVITRTAMRCASSAPAKASTT